MSLQFTMSLFELLIKVGRSSSISLYFKTYIVASGSYIESSPSLHSYPGCDNITQCIWYVYSTGNMHSMCWALEKLGAGALGCNEYGTPSQDL